MGTKPPAVCFSELSEHGEQRDRVVAARERDVDGHTIRHQVVAGDEGLDSLGELVERRPTTTPCWPITGHLVSPNRYRNGASSSSRPPNLPPRQSLLSVSSARSPSSRDVALLVSVRPPVPSADRSASRTGTG